MFAKTDTRFAARRLGGGFLAGFLSVLVFSNGAIALYQAFGAPVPFAPWSMAPLPPFGVPQTLSAAFFGGLWGVAYAAIEPWLTARLSRLGGGIAFGALPLLVLWFVVFPLKGIPLGGGFTAYGVQLGIVLHAAFGLGLAIFYWTVRRLFERSGSAPAATLVALIAVAAALAATPQVAQAQLAGIGRVDLQRHDLSAPGREVIQVLVDFGPGVVAERHSHPGEEIVYVVEGVLEYRLDGRPPVTLKAGEVLFIPSGSVHGVANVGPGKAVELATYIVEKGKPLIALAE
jgi:quercetin dioxygenase-like cupin family protein